MTTASVMRSVHRVATQLRDTLKPLGMNVTQSNGAAVWKEVFHYHVHLVPRYSDDELAPPWRLDTASTRVDRPSTPDPRAVSLRPWNRRGNRTGSLLRMPDGPTRAAPPSWTDRVIGASIRRVLVTRR